MTASVVRVPAAPNVRGHCACGWVGELRRNDVAGYSRAFRDTAGHAAVCAPARRLVGA